MARIVGNLVPEDDYPHEPGAESNYNESMYFNFFDPGRRVGGWCRIGNRPNEGRAETSVCLYDTRDASAAADGKVWFQFRRPEIPDNRAFEAGGLAFEVLEPGERLRTTYRGEALELREPRAMAEPRRAFRDNPLGEVRFDLEHRAVGPLYGRSGDAAEGRRAADQQFAKAHYEQHMAVTGELVLGDESFAIEGFGLRDHSWGPRTWQAIHRYEWLTMNFGPDLGAMVSVIQRDAGGESRSAGGVIVRGDELERIVEAEVEADYESNGLYHRAVHARVVTETGEKHAIEGRVEGFIPLRNRRGGAVTHIGEGMTRWRFGDREGHGLSELLRQVA